MPITKYHSKFMCTRTKFSKFAITQKADIELCKCLHKILVLLRFHVSMVRTISVECSKHFFTDYITLSRILSITSIKELTNEAGLRETATFINALMMELSVRTTNTILLFFGNQKSHSRTLLCSASCHK